MARHLSRLIWFVGITVTCCCVYLWITMVFWPLFVLSIGSASRRERVLGLMLTVIFVGILGTTLIACVVLGLCIELVERVQNRFG